MSEPYGATGDSPRADRWGTGHTAPDGTDPTERHDDAIVRIRTSCPPTCSPPSPGRTPTGPRHIGHVSGFGVPSDVFSRYMRMAGPRRADGLGHRRARHADPRPGRAGGCAAEGARRPVQPADRRRPARPRAVVRPVHPHDDAQPLRRRPGAVPHPAPQRLHGRADDDGRHLAVDGTHAARPLHRGHVPDLRVRRRPGRSVRQLWQPARPGRPDQPALADQRRDAAVRADRAVLPRPAGPRRRPRFVAAEPHRLAAERAQVLAQPARRPAAAGDDPRHRLGRSRAAARLGGQPQPSGSTCGSTP